MVVVKEFGLFLITVNEFANIANSFTVINVKVASSSCSCQCPVVVVKEFGLFLITVKEFANIANSFTVINVKAVVVSSCRQSPSLAPLLQVPVHVTI